MLVAINKLTNTMISMYLLQEVATKEEKDTAEDIRTETDKVAEEVKVEKTEDEEDNKNSNADDNTVEVSDDNKMEEDNSGEEDDTPRGHKKKSVPGKGVVTPKGQKRKYNKKETSPKEKKIKTETPKSVKKGKMISKYNSETIYVLFL